MQGGGNGRSLEQSRGQAEIEKRNIEMLFGAKGHDNNHEPSVEVRRATSLK